MANHYNDFANSNYEDFRYFILVRDLQSNEISPLELAKLEQNKDYDASSSSVILPPTKQTGNAHVKNMGRNDRCCME
jgi:hypothetical protein